MAQTAIRGRNQIKNGSIDRSKLDINLLQSTDLNLTNGGQDATITGLKEGSNPSDAVTKSQLDALAASVSGTLRLQGELDASNVGATLDNAQKGDYYVVTVAGTIAGSIAANVGDHIIVKNTVVGSPAASDLFLQDNSESSDIVRDGDIFDGLTSTDTTQVLSAAQGKVLNDRLEIVENAQRIPVYGEELSVTNGSAVLPALINAPIVNSERVYLNGLRARRGAGQDYTINFVTGVIVMEFPLASGDTVIVDYDR